MSRKQEMVVETGAISDPGGQTASTWEGHYPQLTFPVSISLVREFHSSTALPLVQFQRAALGRGKGEFWLGGGGGGCY